MADDAPAFTPVNLLTGFLGSGKTTLLARLLGDPALSRTAVLINEFGEVGLDHHLIDRVDGGTVLLKSGCVCCTIRGDLAQALRDLHGRRERGEVPAFDRVVIESTGLADPFPILSTLKADPVLRHHFRPGNVVTTVDAVNGLAQIERHDESVRQATAADRLVLTKTDLSDEVRVARLSDRLRRLNPSAALVVAGTADAETLLGRDVLETGRAPASARAWFAETFRAEPADGAAAADHGHPHGAVDRNDHLGRIRSFAMVVDRPVDWTAFGIWLTMLLNRHGERVLRVKGILALEGEDLPVAVHGVLHLVHTPVHMSAWPSEDRASRLVFIVDGLDPDLVRRSFAAYVGCDLAETVRP
ncbi:CobW family GTP-binding protein [Oharaeibacter diazotrophicus]|uniref:G3E family GTPase n=1 Tax=Oharaeibacter diazotrophicus TaxID=1920512 RepID=A0A4R6RJS8_9HYPH|nr:GTP-binding protein [Oharaeibacter diazotrophicus]TDP86829.1 G3E family GTPase [Oharaeibacter diazotrophicus]BBE71228.1 putative GTP-binding protein YjiA [Pleomorphomonas sp. SM30]GLS77982.1 cobalamin biosynthesis protein CobW [Oharaeibacter diazotrophicus]